MRLNYLVLISLLMIGCGKSVEIPNGKVGVVFDQSSKEVMNDILKPGYHRINSNEVPVLFDTSPKEINFLFDVLFKDASAAMIEFEIIVEPKIEGLPDFLRNNSTTNFVDVVKVEIETIVRNELLTLSPNINQQSIFKKIENSFSSDANLQAFMVLNELKEGRIEVLH